MHYFFGLMYSILSLGLDLFRLDFFVGFPPIGGKKRGAEYPSFGALNIVPVGGVSLIE
jgi:hypothetical protein